MYLSIKKAGRQRQIDSLDFLKLLETKQPKSRWIQTLYRARCSWHFHAESRASSRVSRMRTDLFFPTHRYKLIHRKRIAHPVQRLMARQAFGLIHTGPMLFGGRERSVVPIFIAQHVGDVIAQLVSRAIAV